MLDMDNEYRSDILTAKEYLEYVRDIPRKIANIKLEIQECKRRIYTLNSIDYSKEPIVGGISIDIGDKVAALEEEIQRKQQKITHLQDKRAYAVTIISSLADEIEKNILLRLYIENESWKSIIVDYERHIDEIKERQLYRKRDSGIKNIEKISKCQ